MTTVEDLLPYLRPELIFVNSAATPEHIRTLMIVNGISRVPIIDGPPGRGRHPGGRTCRGIVRMRAFFERRPDDPALATDEMMDQAPPEVRVRTSLFEAIETLEGHREVLVRDEEGILFRLLTPRGLADWWSAYSRPFLALEEFEKALRDVIRPFEGKRLAGIVDVERVEELNPRDYDCAVRELWDLLPALNTLDRAVVHGVLVAFAEQRNKLMHFRLDDKLTMEPYLRTFGRLQEWIRRTMPAAAPGHGSR
jgi:CBS domain-containing protein